MMENEKVAGWFCNCKSIPDTRQMPSSANLRPSLENHPFACNLDREQIASLEACAEECSIARGQYIWHQGEPDEDIYLIFSGQVALEISVPQQGSLQIEMVGEGDVLGWSCLLPPRPSYFDARAITPVHACACQVASFVPCVSAIQALATRSTKPFLSA
jgi:CRP-like cAMP-binding protein